MKKTFAIAALVVLGGGLGAGLVDAMATHSDAIATAVCAAPVVPSAPLVNRYCPKPGVGYLEGYGDPLTTPSAKP